MLRIIRGTHFAGLRAPTWTEGELNQATQDFCREHRLPEAVQRPQVYDAFMFNSELDMLEVRLLELYDFVDYFVIREPPVPYPPNRPYQRQSCQTVYQYLYCASHKTSGQAVAPFLVATLVRQCILLMGLIMLMVPNPQPFLLRHGDPG